MSFLKQPFDFLIDRDDMIDITFPGYIMILVVCAVTLFLIIPKGDTVITPVMETTVTETVEMTDPRTVTKGEEVAPYGLRTTAATEDMYRPPSLETDTILPIPIISGTPRTKPAPRSH